MSAEDDKANNSLDAGAPKEKAEFLRRVVPVVFEGRDRDMLEKGFCTALGVKKLDQVLIDVLVTNRRVIAAPATKDRSGLAALGLLLGTGGLGAAAVGLLSGVANLWARADARTDLTHEVSVGSALAECAVWERATLSFEVSEQREVWDLMGGEWSTSPRFSGPCQYQGSLLDAAFEVPFAGRFGNLPLRTRPTELEPLLRLFEYDVSRVRRR